MSENQNPPLQHGDQPPIKAAPSPSPSAESKAPDYAPYPKLDPKDVAPPSENWADVSMSGGSVAAAPPPPPPSEASRSAPPGPTPTLGGDAATTLPAESNPYVSPAPASKNKMDAVKDVLGKWGKKAAEATKMAEDLAGNVWQHLKTGPSFADAAVGRIAQSTKVLAEGGYEKVFKQTFESLPDEQLTKTYACYLSTRLALSWGLCTCQPRSLHFVATTLCRTKLVIKLNGAIISLLVDLMSSIKFKIGRSGIPVIVQSCSAFFVGSCNNIRLSLPAKEFIHASAGF
ncbi:unnamed protein product [Linum tenue]|uniref:Uncharacterized protein n=1 Tax=Linum tenue TaxID=586396 RepID=A0AAV0MP01_9ROSI|nr:unnamed protein product [Linum tenue]